MTACRELRDLEHRDAMRILTALTTLGDDPYAEGLAIRKLVGVDVYRLRVGRFRVVYQVPPIAHRIADYAAHSAHFWSLYRALESQGWTTAERHDLWTESLHDWWRAPDRAAYRLRIAHADHKIDQGQHQGEQL
ncbi:type II toxin-antitoxin system RelE family toxin [Nocardia sp. IBHARD005]|uniref:type II toxin-antitoxin system RelE family toxin n=1 Tax=Nocardia sp. IBHARD005 TaxID=3457765 RepID=UPI0040596A35